jgi:hypothetical protein
MKTEKDKQQYKYLVLPALQYDLIISLVLVLISFINYPEFIDNNGYIFPIASLCFCFVLSFDSVYANNNGNTINEISSIIITVIMILISIISAIKCFSNLNSIFYLIITKSAISFIIARKRYVRQKQMGNILIFGRKIGL